MLKIIIILILIVGAVFLVKTQLDKTSILDDRLEMKCMQAYSLTISNNRKAKDLGLPFDEELTALKKICGKKFIEQLATKEA